MISAATADELDVFCEKLSIAHGPDMRGMKLTTDKGIEAMVAFDYWTPNSVQIHVWSGGHFTRRFLYEIFKYLFVTNDKGIVICVIPCDNTASLDFSRRVGFRKIYEIPDGWAPGTSMVIQELRKHECIWLRGQHGNEQSARPTVRSGSRPDSHRSPTGKNRGTTNGQSGDVSFRPSSSRPE